MIFRGFVVESFVIPTGSMAPTLLGQHWLVESTQTGTTTQVGVAGGRPDASRLRDWQISRDHGLSDQQRFRSRMGDRIVVAKTLYPFFEPSRFDVVVFKNPTIPFGESANYIKRLVGKPGESIWIVDGDIFIQKADEDRFHVARKPDHVQDAIWQTVHDTQAEPLDPDFLVLPWAGSPWIGRPESAWEALDYGGIRCLTSEPSTLQWDETHPGPDDWTAYNMMSPVRMGQYRVSDLRVAATLVPDQRTLQASFTMEVRQHHFEFTLDAASASISMWPLSDPEAVVTVREDTSALQAGQPVRMACTHSDQRLRLQINGKLVAALEYDWTPSERLEFAMARADEQGRGLAAAALAHRFPAGPKLRWSFRGSSLEIPRIVMDRDLYYRPSVIQKMQRNWNEPADEHREAVQPNRPGAATHPDSIVTLGEDQYFVLGDNSGRSLDGRLWGAPHPLVAAQLDDTPFVVPGDLMIGKAWAVYYPAPHTIGDFSMGLVPDFGRLRFIQ